MKVLFCTRIKLILFYLASNESTVYHLTTLNKHDKIVYQWKYNLYTHFRSIRVSTSSIYITAVRRSASTCGTRDYKITFDGVSRAADSHGGADSIDVVARWICILQIT